MDCTLGSDAPLPHHKSKVICIIKGIGRTDAKLSQNSLHFRPELFNRIQIRTVWRQIKDHFHPGKPDEMPGLSSQTHSIVLSWPAHRGRSCSEASCPSTRLRPLLLTRRFTLPVLAFCSASRYTVGTDTPYANAIPFASCVFSYASTSKFLASLVGFPCEVLGIGFIGCAQTEDPAVRSRIVLVDLHGHPKRGPGVRPARIKGHMGRPAGRP